MKEFIKKLRAPKLGRVRPLLLLVLFLTIGVAGARAQDEDASADTPGVQRELGARRRTDGAAGLLRILNLTPEQRAQIGAIRRETEPQGRVLGARLRQARRALDEAIYAANPDEAVIEGRLRELGAAQMAVVRLRSLTELRIRRVLSPAQLDAFRRLQRQTRTRPRRMNQFPERQGDLPGDAPARFRNRRQRRAQEEQEQQRRLPNQQ
jgi:Spy/CpxP family protein refolding chaperone